MINVTRDDVLRLMRDLPAEHWFQNVLLGELNNLTKTPVIEGTDVEPVLGERKDDRVPYRGPYGFQAKPGKCAWECYNVGCNEQHMEDGLYCTNHVDKKCWCGAPATHGCNVELQFVCGYGLCNKHTRCEGH